MLRQIVVRARALFRRSATEAELDQELAYHLEREVGRLVAGGMAPNDAAIAAQRAFGNAAVLKEEVRDSWGLRWVEHLGQDIRFAVGGVRRAPPLVGTHGVTIARGRGRNTKGF